MEVIHPFYIVSDKKLADKYQVNYPGFMLVKNYDQNIERYAGDMLNLANIQKFIVEKTLKDVFVLGPEDNSPMFTHEIPYMILFSETKADDHMEILNKYTAIGKKLGSKVKFAIADYTNPFQESIAEICGIFTKEERNISQIFIFRSSGSKYER